MIGLMDLTEGESSLLVRIAEGVLLDGLYLPRPYWQPSGQALNSLDYDDYWSLIEKGLIVPIQDSCHQVMPTRDAVQLIRWLQELDS
jgi:hypothetical protein